MKHPDRDTIPPDDKLGLFIVTAFKPNKKSIHLNKIHEELIEQMKHIDAKEIENFVDIIVGLIRKLRERKS